jgi:integrase
MLQLNSNGSGPVDDARIKRGSDREVASFPGQPRLREILHLKWEHVDFERGLLFLSDSKTGKKTVVLNAAALTVLRDLTRASDYVIAGEDPIQPRSDIKRPWSLVIRHAKLAGLRVHDLRHSFASIGGAGGLGLPIVGKLLGHANASTTARYAHS